MLRLVTITFSVTFVYIMFSVMFSVMFIVTFLGTLSWYYLVPRSHCITSWMLTIFGSITTFYKQIHGMCNTYVMKRYISLTGNAPVSEFFSAMAIRQLYEYIGFGYTLQLSPFSVAATFG